MFEQGVQVGVLRTRLGIKGKEYDGPRTAAKTILHYVTGDDDLKELPEEQ